SAKARRAAKLLPASNDCEGCEWRHSGKRKRKNMKTTKLTIIASVALALTLSAWSANAVERGSARGGATDLITPLAPASTLAEAVVMACPKCQSEWLVKT